MSDDATRRAELIEHFGDAVAKHEDVMLECLSICRLYSLPPSELFFKHEAYLLDRMSKAGGGDVAGKEITRESAREIRAQIQRDMERPKAGPSGQAGGATPASIRVGGARGRADVGGFMSTPARPGPSSAVQTPGGVTPKPFRPTNGGLASSSYATPQRPTQLNGQPNGISSSPMMADSPIHANAKPFGHRPSPNELMETLNAHLDPSAGVPTTIGKQRIKLSASTNPDEWSYRYMFEKLSDKAKALDTMIDDFASEFMHAYNIADLSDPSLISEDSVFVVGRVISQPTDTGKPTDSSLLLESSRQMGAGRRVPLRFSPGVKVRGGSVGVKGFGVYAGALVALKGRNGGGGVFVVEELMLPPPGDMPSSEPAELMRYQHDLLDGQPLGVVVASGPFTLDSDLLYEPLEALLENARTERPDAIILLGPFVDSAHPLIRLGEVDETPLEIFRNQVASRLVSFLEACPATAIILIPGVRDMISRHVAFPQAMLDRSVDLGLPKKIRLLPNPSTFYINEVMFSLCSVDVLFHLRKEEYFRRAEEAEADVPMDGKKPEAQGMKDSMAELVRHVLGQRSFYPLFPPPQDLAGDVNLDITHHHLMKMTDMPDVLIIPSKLKHFAKIVDSIVTINPSHLSRASSAGTYAKLAVHPMTRREVQDAARNDAKLEHRVYERARVDIVRV